MQCTNHSVQHHQLYQNCPFPQQVMLSTNTLTAIMCAPLPLGSGWGMEDGIGEVNSDIDD